MDAQFYAENSYSGVGSGTDPLSTAWAIHSNFTYGDVGHRVYLAESI